VRQGSVADLLDLLRWPAVLGLAFAGVFLLAGLPFALLTVAGLLFVDLVVDLLIEGASRYGRAGRS
jgi:hypothetical protein